jgi:hypothetical protein
MSRAPRIGSVIIYCIGLSAIIVMIGYGFLRSTMRDTTAGSSSQHVLLAQAAARAGVAEATEAIIADYVSTSLEVGSGAGGSVTIANPPTFLDGPYRAPFVSLLKPNQIANTDDNSADGMNDVRAESMTLAPMMRLYDHNSLGQTTMRYLWHSNGVVEYDGRGRYIEPNYHNVLRPSPAGASPQPISPTRFLDGSASAATHSGLFLDANLHRIASDGSSAGDLAARAVARYRMRYALGVIDLGGHLLSNPKADMDVAWTNQANDYRQPSDSLREAAEAWYNMVARFPPYPTYSDHNTQALRWQHVFLGRGNAMNYDRHWTTSLPSTFPFMFRRGNASAHWGQFAEDASHETTGLYRYAVGTYTQAGGQTLPGIVTAPYIYANTGPQPSWYTQQQSVKGFMNEIDGCYYAGEHAPPMESAMLLPTPFGRGVTATSKAPAARTWYEGRCATPWYINVLTAPPRVIECMLMAYLPPSFKSLRYTEQNFALSSSKSTLMLGSWQTINVRRTAVRGHDLFTRLAGPAFSEWITPNVAGVDPNFMATDPRSPAEKYPGALWNDTDLDDLGKDIDASSRLGGSCSHIGVGLATSLSSTYEGLQSWGGYVAPTPSGWGVATDWYFQRLGEAGSRSYWWDIRSAFTSAIAIARASWVQYPNGAFLPDTTSTPPASYTFDPSSLRDPTRYNSIEKLDRLFVQQMGENFDNPGDGTPLAPIEPGSSGNSQTYKQSSTAISNTIKTLVSGGSIATTSPAVYTAAERGQIMERVLNDFRMSFFGASPQYCERFRPIDFDHDDKVMCSAYNSSGNAAEMAKGLDRYASLEGDTATYGNRRGTVPNNWFSLTGTFYIGKSHYYRIICRGELFDNVVQRPVSDATLESVLVVDPEGTDITQSHYLFQRWHFNRYTGHLSLLER